MAQRTIVQLVSDLSGDEMEAGEGRTVEFSVDGTSYTIDLTDKEAAGFDKALAMYIEHATKTGGGSAGTRKRRVLAPGPAQDAARTNCEHPRLGLGQQLSGQRVRAHQAGHPRRVPRSQQLIRSRLPVNR